MRVAIRLAVLCVLPCGLWLGWEVVRAERGRGLAVRHLARARWAQARQELARYLRLHPRDSEARVMLAEAYGRDDALDAVAAAEKAIASLERVPDDSPLGSKARAQEGRLRFLLLQQPARAERLLRRAIDLDRDNYDAHYMLWKLLDMTGRTYLTESVFWRVYELSPLEERTLRLREWFLSEFNLSSETAPLDRRMGFLDASENPGVVAVYRRLQQFRAAEPESPIAACAMARLFLREGMRDKAREVLGEFESVEDANTEPYYIATRISVLLDFGEFEQARACLERWPEPKSGYEYWKWKATLLDEVERNDEEAIAAYDQALSVWPGREDWQLMFRKAHCLNRLGRIHEAEDVRRQVERFEKAMERDVHAALVKSLAHLDNPREVASIADFYRKLGRTREADGWEEYRQRLIRGHSALPVP